MPTASRLLVSALALLACACGGGTLDDDLASVQADFDAGKLESVVERAPAVLERCQAEGAPAQKAWQVEKLRVWAVAKQGHGGQALEHLARLAGTHADKVDGKLYAQVGGFVIDAKNYVEAADVLHAGAEKFPDLKPIFDPQIQTLIAKAQAEGDTGALDHLKALGYL